MEKKQKLSQNFKLGKQKLKSKNFGRIFNRSYFGFPRFSRLLKRVSSTNNNPEYRKCNRLEFLRFFARPHRPFHTTSPFPLLRPLPLPLRRHPISPPGINGDVTSWLGHHGGMTSHTFTPNSPSPLAFARPRLPSSKGQKAGPAMRPGRAWRGETTLGWGVGARGGATATRVERQRQRPSVGNGQRQAGRTVQSA